MAARLPEGAYSGSIPCCAGQHLSEKEQYKLERGFSQGCVVIGQGGMALN